MEGTEFGAWAGTGLVEGKSIKEERRSKKLKT